MSCICSSVYGEGESDTFSWANWIYRMIFFAEDWAPFSTSEKNISIMSVDELQKEINKMQEKKDHLLFEIQALQDSIKELIEDKLNVIIDYERTQEEYAAKKKEFESSRIDCRLKELEIAKRHSEIQISIENQEREFERLKEEAISRKDQLRSSWAEFLQTTANGNKVFSQLISGVAAPQLLLTELAAYDSYLTEKENEVFMSKIFQWGNDWQNRPLSRAYAMVYVREIQCKHSGEEEPRNAQALFALNVNGERELLAIFDEECLSEQLAVSISELKNHHVREIYLICIPDIEDLKSLLQKSYPDSELYFLSSE